jgi:hypothetical protein
MKKDCLYQWIPPDDYDLELPFKANDFFYVIDITQEKDNNYCQLITLLTKEGIASIMDYGDEYSEFCKRIT